MKKYYLLALLPLCSCTQEDWVTYPVDQHLTVQLPMRPQTLNLKQMGVDKALKYKSLDKLSALGAADEYGLYGIVINSAVSSNKSSQLIARDSLYNHGIQAMLRANPGSLLLKRTTFPSLAGNGVEVIASVIFKEKGTRALVFNRTLVVADKSYSFTFNPKGEQDSITGSAQRRRFFHSITVIP